MSTTPWKHHVWEDEPLLRSLSPEAHEYITLPNPSKVCAKARRLVEVGVKQFFLERVFQNAEWLGERVPQDHACLGKHVVGQDTEASCVVLTGVAGCTKTFLAQHQAMAIAGVHCCRVEDYPSYSAPHV
jgi:hypothetical protein